MSSDGSTERAHRVIERLTLMILWFAALFGALGALISLMDTPDLAYNGGPMGFALSVLAAMMIIYAADQRRNHVE